MATTGTYIFLLTLFLAAAGLLLSPAATGAAAADAAAMNDASNRTNSAGWKNKERIGKG